ncbi:MAG: hypothetical protein DYG99_10255 [Bacteroidetes bacterium CHB5]|nr:hypothetical protein [Bacteroidetes bacterium CHB5]
MRLRTQILVVGLVVSVSLQAQYKFYQTGFEQYKQGKYTEAIANFSNFLRKSSREKSLDVEVHYLRGLAYIKTDNFKTAIPDLQESIRLGHTNAGNIYWFLAQANEKSGYYFDAINAYDQAIKILPADKETLIKLYQERAQVFLKVDKRPLAYADLYRAYELQPSNQDIKSELEKFSKEEVAVITQSQNQALVPSVIREDKTKLMEFYKDEKRYALVIGNAQYSKEIGELRNPVNDAIDMASELEKSNFEVQLLTNATYGQMRAELQKFKDKLEAGPAEKTVGLFYFAGHGLRQEQENYLVPVDAKIEFEDDIWRYCFPVQRMVLANMERSNSRLNIVILDACRNNPFPSITRGIGNQGLVEMAKAKGSFIAFATAPGSVAIDGSGRNGLYTQEVLKAMRIPGLTIEQVFKEVRKNVLRLSSDKQNTWDNSNIIGEFYFKF